MAYFNLTCIWNDDCSNHTAFNLFNQKKTK